jgi:hypothetical protein
VSSGSPIAVGTGTVTLDFALLPRPAVQVPGPPQDLSAVISAGTVAFSWNEPYEFGTPTDYVLQIGLAPGTTFVSIPVAATTYAASGVPPGRYYASVRGRNGAGMGPPSSEYEVIVNIDGSGAPGAPSDLVVFHDGSNLEMSWAGPYAGGPATGYLLEIGTATGLSNIAAIPVGPRSVFTYSAPIPAGAYFVRVRATNALSVGPPSHEVMFVSGSGPAPPDPPGFPGFAIDASRRVLLGWLPPRGPVTNYLVEAGTALYKSDIGAFPIAGSATSFPIAGAPPGIYYVRMRSVNAQGAGVPSYDMTVIVP